MGLPAYAFWQALRIKTMNYRIIFHTTGKVLLVEAGLLALPLLVSVLYHERCAWAVLASMIGLGGLGDFVYRGTSSNNNTLILLGAIPAAILAVLFGLVIDLLQKRVTPRGLRKEAGK